MLLLAVTLLLHLISAETAFQFRDDDYIQYRTLSNHRIIKWNITWYDRSAVAPGYWFTAPYWQHDGDHKTNQWIPYQVGPHIFDQDGVLIWAGSAISDNRNAFEFRKFDVVTPGDSQRPPQSQSYLVWMLWFEAFEPKPTNGSIVIYNSHYEPVQDISLPAKEVDTHEFNVKGTSKALMIVVRHDLMTLADLGRPDLSQIIHTNGFVEMDPLTGERIFEWYSDGKVSLDESYVIDAGSENFPPDFMHCNSIDKNVYGDYLLSARHTSTIYLISGKDGHIIWRLGGKKNDFIKDFNFFGQHDAKFISVNETHFLISFLDNGAIDENVVEPTSSALYVQLDIVAMTATIVQRYMRPDGGSTERRGNMQTLPNSNVLVAWSWDSYITEFSLDGRLLMEAKFASDRLDTYRAFKFPWVGRPHYPPTILSECYGVNGSELSTVFHVSWNGATDIAYWRFFARTNSTSPKREIGLIRKEGFESSFIARGYMDWVSVEALDSSMAVLGTSLNSRTPAPEYWAPGETLPRPDDPEMTPEGEPAQSLADPNASIAFFIAGVVSCGVFCALVVRQGTIRRRLRLYCRRVTSTGYSRASTQEPDSPRIPEDKVNLLTVRDY